MSRNSGGRSAKQSKTLTQGGLRTVPESRARRETLEVKQTSGLRPASVRRAELGGSRSDRAAASRSGRQPVLESPDEHPAGKGPPMTRREAREQDALGARMKPAAAVDRRPSRSPAPPATTVRTPKASAAPASRTRRRAPAKSN